MVDIPSFKQFIGEQLEEPELSQIELDEATAEEVHAKYYSNIPKETFDQLYRMDPTAKDNKFGEYSKWIIERYKKLKSDQQPGFIKDNLFLNSLREKLWLYHKAKKLGKIDKKDINVFKTKEEFVDYLDSKKFSEEELKSKAELDREIKEKGAEKVFEDDDWLVIIPHTRDAACFYGSGTNWCTAAKSNSHFDAYSRQGPLYIMISKKEKDDEGRSNKYQFHFQSNQYMDIHDHPVAHSKGDALNWISDNMGDEAQEFFARTAMPEFQRLADKLGHNDPEVIKAARQIIHKWYSTSPHEPEKYAVFDHSSQMNYFINSISADLRTVEELYKRLKKYDFLESDDTLDTEIVENLVDNMSNEMADDLSKHYHIKESDYSNPDEYFEDLADAIDQDKDLMKELRDVYHASAKGELFNATKELFFEELVKAACGAELRGSGYDEEPFYLNLSVFYELNGKLEELSSESPAEALDADGYYTLVDISRPVDLALALDEQDWETEFYYDDYDARQAAKKIPDIQFDYSLIKSKVTAAINKHLGKGTIKHEKQLELDLAQFDLMGFKQFVAPLNELNYKDAWGKQFVEFREKYKALADNIRKNLYVHFGNFAGSTLEKTPFHGKDMAHDDPIGVYVYPLDYVLDHPADIQYGFGAKFLRVLKQVCAESQVLNLQTVSREDVEKLLETILDDREKAELDFASGGADNLYDSIIAAIQRQHKIDFHDLKKPGGVALKGIQKRFIHSMREITAYKTRPNKEQTDLLIKAGYLMVKDLDPATGKKTRSDAIINPYEPEQAVFLRRDAFKIVDVYQLKSQPEPTNLLNEPLLIADKLAKRIARYLDLEIRQILHHQSFKIERDDKTVFGKYNRYNTNKNIYFQIGFLDRKNHAHRAFKEHNDEDLVIWYKDWTIPYFKEVFEFMEIYPASMTFNEIFQAFVKKIDEIYATSSSSYKGPKKNGKSDEIV